MYNRYHDAMPFPTFLKMKRFPTHCVSICLAVQYWIYHGMATIGNIFWLMWNNQGKYWNKWLTHQFSTKLRNQLWRLCRWRKWHHIMVVFVLRDLFINLKIRLQKERHSICLFTPQMVIRDRTELTEIQEPGASSQAPM